MKTARFILLGFAALLTAYVVAVRMQDSVDSVKPVTEVDVMQAIAVIPENTQLPPVLQPIEIPVAKPLVIALAEPVLIEPVQPIEDRGAAMLSEIDMLQGMPFDQAIILPFD